MKREKGICEECGKTRVLEEGLCNKCWKTDMQYFSLLYLLYLVISSFEKKPVK